MHLLAVGQERGRMSRTRGLVAQIARFGVVGGFGFVLDVGVFNLLLLSVLAPEHVHGGPVIAKTISTLVAILANWLGNRYWTFATERSDRSVREGVEFAVASIVGMGVGVGCLWFSHYVLHFTTVLDDNVASNVVGVLLGSVVRFWLYRSWVYRPGRFDGAPVPAPARDRVE
jgi:putative flippase GtrA